MTLRSRRVNYSALRDGIVFVGAIVGLVYEARSATPNAEITIGCFGILGAPAWLSLDRRSRRRQEPDDNDDQ